ncbi:MAG: antitoxin family protein [Armatimonadota bacterium]|jgi:predicted DNA-binding antitoxin AbrB/MazE fold protein|nr:antitoxin family protein [Armatimonadota bacterium]MDT7973192.1 antitoxin family protein [Armatimonadota bacterium]
MTVRGVVKNGVIVLLDEVTLPDGLEVRVIIPLTDWSDEGWQRRVDALRHLIAIGSGTGEAVGRHKHEHLAEVYQGERSQFHRGDTA